MKYLVRSIVEIMEDPHEFATAYAVHVDAEKAAGRDPLTVTAAAGQFLRTGSL